MRSFADLARLARYAATDLKFSLFPPSARLDDETSPLSALPDPRPIAKRLRGTAYASEVQRIADAALENKLTILGHAIETGLPIEWRRDFIHNKSSDLTHFRRIKTPDFDRLGEPRIVWELNRHQHLVLLAQAALLSERDEYRNVIPGQILQWAEANRFQHGINWLSPFEAGMRALNWIWVFHLAGFSWETAFRDRFLNLLYQHGAYLDLNCGVAGQTPTERLGAAVALYALGRLFPSSRSKAWRRLAIGFVRHALHRVLADGSWCEQSTFLHLTALDLFLFFYLVANRPKQIRHKLELMAEYLHVLQGPARRLPFIGDDDGGRLFHPYGPRDEFARATLATSSVIFQHKDLGARNEDIFQQAAWWLGEHALDSQVEGTEVTYESRLFQVSGLAVMCDGDRQILADVASFGPSRGHHSHADTLGIIVRTKRDDILIDPGTYTFLSDPAARDWFRGTAAHNTVRIDGLDQATALPAFGWKSRPVVQVVSWTEDANQTSLEATCHVRGVSHRRSIRFYRPAYLFVVDFIEGRSGFHFVEQFWHPGPGNEWRVLFPHGIRVHREEGWQSSGFSLRQPATILRVRTEGDLPLVMPALILLNDEREHSCELREIGHGRYALFQNGEHRNEFKI